MGICVTKRALGRSPTIVSSNQVTNDYDMSTVHPGQLTRSFLFSLGTQLDAQQDVDMIASCEPFFRLMRVRGKNQAAMRSCKGRIIGLFLRYATERNVREVGHMCSRTYPDKTISLHLSDGEYIRRVMLGYGDDSAEALELHTNSRVCSLGDVLDSQYVVDMDFRDQDLGVVGFAARFGTETLTGLSVYTAPVMAKTSVIPFELQEVEGASLALVAAPYSQAIRRQREHKEDSVAVKECFRGAKNRYRSSMHLTASDI